MCNKFRPLRADEIDARIGTVKNGKGVSLLLYKDARCDQNILDETVGPMNWQRSHSRDNANCTVSIWDDEKRQWISKEDTGTESNTEAEKGLASDSFKRACVNWGIGRELYTSPFIWVNGNTDELKYEKFKITEIDYKDGIICALTIVNKAGNIVYKMGSIVQQKPAEKPLEGVKADTDGDQYKRNEWERAKAAIGADDGQMTQIVKALRNAGLCANKKPIDMNAQEYREMIDAAIANYGKKGA